MDGKIKVKGLNQALKLVTSEATVSATNLSGIADAAEVQDLSEMLDKAKGVEDIKAFLRIALELK